MEHDVMKQKRKHNNQSYNEPFIDSDLKATIKHKKDHSRQEHYTLQMIKMLSPNEVPVRVVYWD